MSESFVTWFNKIFVAKPKKDLKTMSKIELEKKGREVGIELDRRLKKATLLKQLQKKIGE
jgi:hypothetical protein|tara:strand:- start:1651 stop:1830 length:180 start_codon:yes stop_codon:yes gene_type:complete